jgi:altronate dehydratase small subunit
MLSAADNVATAIADVDPGAEVAVRLGKRVTWVTALERIPYGFKIAVTAIAQGDPVFKYGEPIGVASSDIARGQLVHVHNLEGARGRGDLAGDGTG